MEFQPGDVLRDGRYVVQRRLRSARDKSIYLGHDRKFDCQVTIDVFASNNSIMPDGLTVSAWEARVLGKLGDHPNVARVVDQWEDDQAAIMVSRYFPGGTLLELIARSRDAGENVPVERILQVAAEIAHGLAYIHGRRILYLDLQPRNVLFDELGTVHLVDFDTAVPLDQPDVSHLADRPVIVYMAPELTDGGGADERADLYSLGATIYEMAAGGRPSLEAVRRYWPRAAQGRLHLFSGRICPRPCATSSPACCQPTAHSGRQAQLRSLSSCRASARLVLTSSGFWRAMNQQDLSSRHRSASRSIVIQGIRGPSGNSGAP